MSRLNTLWWQQSERELAGALWDTVEELWDMQSYRRSQIITHARLYGDREIAQFAGLKYERARTSGTVRAGRSIGQQKRLSLNVVRNMVDTATSRLTLNRPGVEWDTSYGDFTLQQIAKQRKMLVDGHFHEGDMWHLRGRNVKNAVLYGTGCAQTVERFGRVCYEYVFPGELLVDELEAATQSPANIYRDKLYDRERAKQLFAKNNSRLAKAIDEAPGPSNHHYGRRGSRDQVVIRCGWHVDIDPEGKQGLAVAAVRDAVLYKKPFVRKHQQVNLNNVSVGPFSFWRWSEETTGFWGSGLGEQLYGIQCEINSLLRLIQNNMYLGGNIKVFLERGSKIVDAQISNALHGALVEYTGAKPEFHVHDVITNQVIQHLETLIRYAYEITGISQISAQGQMPSGLSGSGRSQLVYQNIESKRFVMFQRNDEAAVKSLAQQTVELARAIAEDQGTYKVRYHDDNWIEEVDAKEALKDTGVMEVRATPASQMPHDYAGKVAFAEYMQQIGWVDQEQAMALADVPEVNKHMQLALAPRRIVEKHIELMLEKGEPQMPVPRIDLQLAHRLATAAYLHGMQRGIPQENLDILDNYILTIEAAQAKAAQNAGSPGGGAGVPLPTATDAAAAAGAAGAPPSPDAPLAPPPVMPAQGMVQ